MAHGVFRTCGALAPSALAALLWAFLSALVALPAIAQVNGLEQVLEVHTARYPEMEPDDLYKLLHQAALGSEHAVGDRGAARLWLSREIESLHPSDSETSGEPLTEPLSPDGRIVRVNLRPFLARGGDPEALLDAFVRTGEQYRGDKATLDHYCQIAIQLASERRLPFSPTELEARFAELEGQGYPAVHHTSRYNDAYRPAYRVVLRELLSLD